MHKLLVVDDNTTVQRVIKLAFKDEDVTVTAVQKGRDPFSQIEANPPDIVLADNAREVAHFLRSKPALSHIPVILLKGAFDSAVDSDDEDDCDDVLMKPLQPQTMIDRVKRLLDNPRHVRRPASVPVPFPQPATPEPPPTYSNGNPAARITGADALDLGAFFDQLNVAFSKAESATQAGTAQPEWLPPARAKKDVAPRDHFAVIERPAAPIITEDMIEQITQRVLERLTDRMVRTTATEVVARLSKWLLVDGIERTKEGK
jgi:CheY-like chemotaxis protein